MFPVAAASPSPQSGDIGRDGARYRNCIHRKGIKKLDDGKKVPAFTL
jgi:hypothetical protein